MAHPDSGPGAVEEPSRASRADSAEPRLYPDQAVDYSQRRMAFFRCNTFYIQRIDAGYHRGLPSTTDIHSLGACKYKTTSTLDTGPSTSFFNFLTGVWVLDSACTFSFTFN